MHDRFTPLASWLAPARPEPVREASAAAEEPSPQEIHQSEYDEAMAGVRRFRAALDEALDAMLETLLREVAVSVTARALQLEDADLVRIVEQARERYALDEPLALCVHPRDAAQFEGLPYAVEMDPELRRGDVVICVRNGSIDARLGVRLERVLEAFRS
jgi:flagellar biosynthesis/type III secretory pathway protein FliH